MLFKTKTFQNVVYSKLLNEKNLVFINEVLKTKLASLAMLESIKSNADLFILPQDLNPLLERLR